MEGHYRSIIEQIGEDPEREGLLKTPERVAKAMKFLTHGYDINPDEIIRQAIFHEDYSEMVIVKHIEVYSMCEHHMLPFFGKAHVAYIPGKDGKVVGLSKLNRIVEHFARRGAIQEQLTVAIHNAVSAICEDNAGVMVVVHSFHNCVSCRGVKHFGASMVTSEVSGVFADHAKTAKQEVLEMLKFNLQAYI